MTLISENQNDQACLIYSSCYVLICYQVGPIILVSLLNDWDYLVAN